MKPTSTERSFMFNKSATIVIIAFVAAAACSKEAERKVPASDSLATSDKAASATPAKPTGEGAHASATVTPGSHEDWCGDHGVPESQCTKCNPDLVAAFKATGDWCAEHAIPESQCTLCDPNLKIVRPPKEGAK